MQIICRDVQPLLIHDQLHREPEVVDEAFLPDPVPPGRLELPTQRRHRPVHCGLHITALGLLAVGQNNDGELGYILEHLFIPLPVAAHLRNRIVRLWSLQSFDEFFIGLFDPRQLFDSAEVGLGWQRLPVFGFYVGWWVLALRYCDCRNEMLARRFRSEAFY